jgi:hypothetical protein
MDCPERVWFDLYAKAKSALRTKRQSRDELTVMESRRFCLAETGDRRRTRRLWAAKTSMEHFAMWEPLNQDWMYDELANLGYPCFAHYRSGNPTYTPARFLAHVLDLPKVEARVVDALPWLVYAFPLMEWDWLIREMMLRGRQNRLGFLVDLAIELAEALGETNRVQKLLPHRDLLNLIKLDKEDTLCNEDMSEGSRNLSRNRRSTTAAHWNLVCGMEVKHLHYTPQYEQNMKSCEAMIPETELHDTLKARDTRCLKRPNHKREHLSFSRSWRDGDNASTLRPKQMYVDRDDPADFTL